MRPMAVNEVHRSFQFFLNWLDGGDGAIELAEAVVDACEDKQRFKFLYDDNISLNSKIELIAKEIYGANGVKYTDKAQDKLNLIQKHPEFKFYGSCMAKTHLSLSHDPSWKGRPEGWILPNHDILIYGGAGIAVPVVGDVKLMPGTASDPAYRKIDIDVKTGKVKGVRFSTLNAICRELECSPGDILEYVPEFV